MADVEPLYCAEQIKVPDALPVRASGAPWQRAAATAPVCPSWASHPLTLAHCPHLLQEIMKEWTKEVLRAQPADIYAWSAKYFAEKAAAAAAAGGGGGK